MSVSSLPRSEYVVATLAHRPADCWKGSPLAQLKPAPAGVRQAAWRPVAADADLLATECRFPTANARIGGRFWGRWLPDESQRVRAARYAAAGLGTVAGGSQAAVDSRANARHRVSLTSGGNMQRRSFLSSASLLAGAISLPLASRGFAASPAPLWQLLWSPTANAGDPWRSIQAACADHCDAESVEVSLDALHPASAGHAVSRLAVNAMFDMPGGGSAPFIAWQFSGAGAAHSATSSTRFIAGRSSMRCLEIEYSLAGVDHVERCDLVGMSGLLLSPGHYLLVGPDADGRPAKVKHLVHSGVASRPLAGPTDFDYLALRIAQTA
jgi:hypothetical protein